MMPLPLLEPCGEGLVVDAVKGGELRAAETAGGIGYDQAGILLRRISRSNFASDSCAAFIRGDAINSTPSSGERPGGGWDYAYARGACEPTALCDRDS